MPIVIMPIYATVVVALGWITKPKEVSDRAGAVFLGASWLLMVVPCMVGA